MRLFQKRQENFVCGNCGYQVTGTGYTNHCPKCLFSKHVDVHPGDRKEICQGLMQPTDVEQKHGEYIILHKCLSCGAQRRNKSVSEDDLEKIIALT